jgi:hypothetical protein
MLTTRSTDNDALGPVAAEVKAGLGLGAVFERSAGR